MHLLEITNDGTEIVKTNYWELPHANHGFCYLTWNAGAGRLLVPEIVYGMGPATEILAEMKTAKFVVVGKRVIKNMFAIGILFDDESDAPFLIVISVGQTDRNFNVANERGKKFPFSVWTQAGKQLQFTGKME